jgi:hypothetical protein
LFFQQNHSDSTCFRKVTVATKEIGEGGGEGGRKGGGEGKDGKSKNLTVRINTVGPRERG